MCESKRTFRQLMILKILKAYGPMSATGLSRKYVAITELSLTPMDANSALQTLARNELAAQTTSGYEITPSGLEQLEWRLALLNKVLP